MNQNNPTLSEEERDKIEDLAHKIILIQDSTLLSHEEKIRVISKIIASDLAGIIVKRKLPEILEKISQESREDKT